MRLILALVIGGGFLTFIGVQDFRLNQASKAEPQEITCVDLVANGPGDNALIVIGDFLLCDFAFVYEEKGNDWSKVWVPAVPLGGEFHQKLLSMVGEDGRLTGEVPMPKDVKVIVKSTDVSNERELSNLAEKDTLQGLVINQIESLGSEEEKILKESYPTVDFDDCWIVEVGRAPATIGRIAGFFLGGVALMVIGGLIALSGRESPAEPQETQQPQEPE
jgi:hypothetical protein